ncbi:MAG: hypothetical protein QG588_1824, partial [Candidatus Poribacteria bacterium]|nr:hypothetical protein [Candidatus Poribacteria bacterium]
MKSFTKKRRSWLFMSSILCLGLIFLYVGCSEDTVITTPGGGNTNSSTKWSVTPQTSGITETSIFEICVEPTNGKIYAVGDKGVILTSADKGTTWTKQDSGGEVPLQSIFFVNENDGWIVGDAGAVLHTSDGGAKWEKQNSGITEKLRSVFFANNTIGWAAGDAGKIINTKDGGIAWNAQSSTSNQPLESIYF